jgi:uridine kinase
MTLTGRRSCFDVRIRTGKPEDAVLLVASVSETKRLVLVAIDGHSAAGKPTLALILQSTLESTTIHGDDFYRVMPETERSQLGPAGGYNRYFDW